MGSKIINKNVLMVKLSIFSWQTHVNMHIWVHFVHGCHIQGYTWIIRVHLICSVVGPPFINLSTTDLAILSINACSASALSPVDDDWPLWVVVLGTVFFPFRDWPGFTFGILSGRQWSRNGCKIHYRWII
jgi:hypothetical protein